MSRQVKKFWAWFFIASLSLSGCHPIQPVFLHEDGDLSHYLDAATEMEHPDLDLESLDEVTQAKRPLTLTNPEPEEIWDLSLEDAISTALGNTKVLRTFGGRVVRGGDVRGVLPVPDQLTLTASADTGLSFPGNSIYDPAIMESSQAGVEQALAAFDAQLNSNLFWDRTDRQPNQRLDLNNFLQTNRRDQVNLQTELTKRSATGSQWFLRSVTTYDSVHERSVGSGVPAGNRQFFSDWFQAYEMEARQPLLRGRGTQVNRIPVVLARIRTDVQLADFEANVRNFVSDIEQGYWGLYFQYRQLQANKIGRDSALVTWRRIHALYEAGAPGGEAEAEAQAREQYFFFRVQVEQSLSDLFKAETRLRYLMGLTTSDGRLIRPSDDPATAKVSFEWNEILQEGLVRSPELRQEKWRIKERELELIAARNQLLPQLDIVGLYRFLGQGKDLLGNDADRFPPADPTQPLKFPNVATSAYEELVTGDYQEGRLGFQFTMPLGFRRELAEVRARQLLLARAKARLEEMELEVVHQLDDAIKELDGQYTLTESNFNRAVAAVKQVEAIEAAFDAGTVTLDLLLDAQRRRSLAESDYYRSLAQYNVSIAQVHLRKGSLLEYDGIVLAEGPWPAKAYFDARTQARRRDASYYLDYGFSRPKVVSQGTEPQRMGLAGETAFEAADVSSSGESTEEPPLEPIPAPMPEETNGFPLQDASFGGPQLPRGDSSATKSAGPQLTAPALSKTGPRNAAIRLVEHTESDDRAPAKPTKAVRTSSVPKRQAKSNFDWGSLGGLSSNAEPKNAGSAAAVEKPAKTISQLRWK